MRAPLNKSTRCKTSTVSTFLLTTTLILPVFAQQAPQITRDNGAPVSENRHSRTAGESGGVLLEDTGLIEKLARFDRERIPERVVHARGTGAQGEFVATADISAITRAAVFTKGTTTPVFVRFSTVIHPKGSPEGLRDPRGFATKFYTTEGNWDLVGNNLPVFFIRDAKQFPDMVHSLKPSPISNQQDPNRSFDFFSHTPESVHMLTQVYSDLGTPRSYRNMDGAGVHTFRFVNNEGKVTFARLYWRTQQGVKTLSAHEAKAADFNYATKDLYDAINAGNFPKWDLVIKVLAPEDISKLNYNPFDATKDWYGIPETKVGTMTLNKVPANFYEYTELSAFAPANLVPGIEASPDRLLQGRLFSYQDTQRYRLGANFQSYAVNAPRVEVVNNYQDGVAANSKRSSDVNYFPSVAAPKVTSRNFAQPQYEVSGLADAKPISTTNNFEQAGIFWRKMTAGQQAALISNLAGDLGQVKDLDVRTTMLSYFYQADAGYGERLAKAVDVPLDRVKKAVAAYQAGSSTFARN